jgi:ATP-dependent Clp protease, protease subunit
MKKLLFPKVSSVSTTQPVACTPTLDDYNTIFLYGEIDESTGRDISEKILLFSFAPYGIEYITLMINSPGGDLSDAFSILSFIEFSSIPIRTISVGLCASAAFMIAMSGNPGERYSAGTTQFLSHNFSMGRHSNYPDLIATRKWEDYLYETMIRHYSRHTNLKDEKSIRKHLLKDVDCWLTPNECLEYGIIDHIIEDSDVPVVTIGGVGNEIPNMSQKKKATKKTKKN